MHACLLIYIYWFKDAQITLLMEMILATHMKNKLDYANIVIENARISWIKKK